MRSYMDDVVYNDRGNQVRMVKRRPETTQRRGPGEGP